MPPDKPPPLDTSQPLYVSVRDGALVPRFTLAGRVSGHIGADRGAPGEASGEEPRGRIAAVFAARDRRPSYVWHPERVAMIPAAEVAMHRVHYTHALANGSLVKRTAREHAAQQTAEQKREAALVSPNGSAPPAGGTDL